MAKDQAEHAAFDPAPAEETFRQADWEDKMEEAWPHLRAAVWQRVVSGEALGDLAGVVTEVPSDDDDPDEESLTIGVLTRDELAETIAESSGSASHDWVARLRRPAPAGCIYVFCSLAGVPGLWTMGPVAPSATPN